MGNQTEWIEVHPIPTCSCSGAGLLREGPSVSEDKYRCKEERDAAAHEFDSLRFDVKLLRTEGTFSFSRATERTGKFDSTSENKNCTCADARGS